jgi:predicted acylesterase/phospholipase RssA
MGLYHLGVVNILKKEGILPRIITGSSAGILLKIMKGNLNLTI